MTRKQSAIAAAGLARQVALPEPPTITPEPTDTDLLHAFFDHLLADLTHAFARIQAGFDQETRRIGRRLDREAARARPINIDGALADLDQEMVLLLGAVGWAPAPDVDAREVR